MTETSPLPAALPEGGRARAADIAEILALTGGDPLIRGMDREAEPRAWRTAEPPPRGAVAFLGTDVEYGIRALYALGAPAAVAALVLSAAAELAGDVEITVPRAADGLIPWRSAEIERWQLRGCAEPPARRPGEEAAGWLGPDAEEEVRHLIRAANPHSSTWPGDAKVVRWAGVRDPAEGGRLVACLADVSAPGEVGHLAGIATHPDARGRGHGAAVTAWATRRILEEGRDLVLLGVFSGNLTARRMYDRLGFAVDTAYSSGHLAPADQVRVTGRHT